MAASPPDLQEVFETVLDDAIRLCHADTGSVLLVEQDHLRPVANRSAMADPAILLAHIRAERIPIGPSTVSGRAVMTRKSAMVADIYADPVTRAAIKERPGQDPRENRTLLAVQLAGGADETTLDLLAALPPAMGEGVGNWDGHKTIKQQYEIHGPILDQPVAGLLRDLKQRGMLNDTLVAFVTEFGRTVAVNGTRGTDHGTAGCAFLVGGAVAGGRVVADWPGLGSRDLHEGRDLRATTDLRALFKGVLHERFGVSESALARTVFPASDAVAPLEGVTA